MLDLAHPPADGGQLDRPHHAGEVRGRLHHADDPPLERAEHLPPVHAARSTTSPDVASYAPTSSSTRPNPPTRGSAPNRHAARTATPGPRGVAAVGQLPVEHGAQAVGPHDQVAVAEVPVDERPARRRRRAVAVQPAEAQLEGRVRLAGGVEGGAELAPGRHRRGRDRADRDAVDAGQRLAALGGRRAGRGELVVRAGSCGRSSRPAPGRRPSRRPAPAAPGPAPSMASAGLSPPPGTGHALGRRARSRAASVAMPAVPGGRRAAPAAGSAAGLGVERPRRWDALPDSRRSPVIAPASVPSTPASARHVAAEPPLDGCVTRSAPAGDRRRRAGADTR